MARNAANADTPEIPHVTARASLRARSKPPRMAGPPAPAAPAHLRLSLSLLDRVDELVAVFRRRGLNGGGQDNRNYVIVRALKHGLDVLYDVYIERGLAITRPTKQDPERGEAISVRIPGDLLTRAQKIATYIERSNALASVSRHAVVACAIEQGLTVFERTLESELRGSASLSGRGNRSRKLDAAAGD